MGVLSVQAMASAAPRQSAASKAEAEQAVAAMAERFAAGALAEGLTRGIERRHRRRLDAAQGWPRPSVRGAAAAETAASAAEPAPAALPLRPGPAASAGDRALHEHQHVERLAQAAAVEGLTGVDVLFLDTGYHFEETLQTRDAVASTYDVTLRTLEPSQSVAQQDATYGANLFERDPDLCCTLRKTHPLDEALDGAAANLEATARALFVHANTVRYRLGRVSEQVGWDATDARDGLMLHMAIIVGRLRTHPGD